MTAFITGAAMTAFGKLAPRTTLDLQAEAAEAALADAGCTRAQVDGLLLGYSTVAPHLMPATRFAEFFGLLPSYAHGVQAGGATGLAMVALARHLVVAGAARNVLVVAGENRRTGHQPGDAARTLAEVGEPDHEVTQGGSVPAYYGLVASQYLHRYGLQERDLAELAVLMRRHAAMTDGAQFTTPITVEDVIESRPVARPLKLLDCCPVSDGAAAILVSASDNGSAIQITGTSQAHTHQHLTQAPDDVALGARQTAAAAFQQAGCTPRDIDRLAIYDSFTVTLAMFLEACGFSAPGEAPADTRAGRFAHDGPLPLNTHGGLLSYGHSGVAGGMAHIVEITRKMRASAKRERGFIHADGGVFSANVSMVLEGCT
ncbi:thiolase family protein [Rhodalgimonas zhirmunskyi]|uniref:Thiolase family protein n=1 Tax=Rhodalgimonas zhirmunskyi TaxID=2964767 RepID=A0AAJ1X6Y5_9RHOB|nr:thiolase family protein [Rhodoalgimonas zhirmunskyi]MDQ2095154.1 thiolase family protein [Rhodoalgimonas zhirmunskyi]